MRKDKLPARMMKYTEIFHCSRCNKFSISRNDVSFDLPHTDYYKYIQNNHKKYVIFNIFSIYYIATVIKYGKHFINSD